MTAEKHKSAKEWVWICSVSMVLSVGWLVFGSTVDFWGWAGLIFFGPAILIFILSAIGLIPALMLAEKYKQAE